MIEKSISQHILFIGPCLDGHGGISTVVNTYKYCFEQYNFIGTTTKRKNKIVHIFILLLAIVKCIRYCFLSEIKIIHIHTASWMDFFKNTLFIIIGKIFKKIIILHIHGAMFDSFCEKYHNSVKIIIARCDYIIGVSLFITNLVNTWNKNIIILPNIVDRPLFEKNKLNNKLQILFLGRIETVKGIFDILKLFEQEREYLKDKVELHIGGIGEDKRLETIINQSKLDDIVIFHGWLDKIEKHKLLSQSDILIQPSYYESFGITIVEGMSYRIPIIASNIGGIPELVEDKVNGILISPGNNQQMFNAIKYFIENEFVIKKMGDESYQRAESFYQENILEKLHDFYEGILYKKL